MAIDVEDLLEIILKNEDDFLKVKETLTRIGVASRKDKTLYQSCHILHKRGKYYIVHFKELFALDGKSTDFEDNDMGRRNTIANLLAEWGLVEIVNKNKAAQPVAPLSQIKIISHKEKDEWQLITKYNIGKKREV
jgi:Bacteriophage translational regulator